MERVTLARRIHARNGWKQGDTRGRRNGKKKQGREVHAKAADGRVENAHVARRDALVRAAMLGATLAGWNDAAKAGTEYVFGDWELVDLPVDPEVILLDVAFSQNDPKHGFVVGTRQTLLETKDGGRNWEPRSIAAARDEDFNYRFNAVSFSGDEGWIIGKPAILLHTTDGGSTWERIPLSAKLPGTPIIITALGNGAAEMATDQGAIYVTSDGAQSWKAAVQETVDATLNRTVSSGISGASYYTGTFATVQRGDDGRYVGVNSRGNFYMTWSPGETFWTPHNRVTGRRLQNMGFMPDGRLWMLTRGGGVYIQEGGEGSEEFAEQKLGSRGFGILDLGFKDKAVGYGVGGSGSLYKTVDGGRTWRREKSADNISGNLYLVKFFDETGYILGNEGKFLRYTA
eukprot:scaffold261_cov336-Pavlova_lutheri.AAC.51